MAGKPPASETLKHQTRHMRRDRKEPITPESPPRQKNNPDMFESVGWTADRRGPGTPGTLLWYLGPVGLWLSLDMDAAAKNSE